MHTTVKNLLDIKKKIIKYSEEIGVNNTPKIIAVSKTFNLDKILPVLKQGHLDFGENKVQEALEKWSDYKRENSKIKLHLIGKLQTNKVKFAVKLFDYIHSVDSVKLAKKISNEQQKINRAIKIFLQVNIGDEKQKSGINKNQLNELISYCKQIKLDVIGLMCIPPANNDPDTYFEEMKILNQSLGFSDLSMGMSSDYLKAIKYSSTYVRIGSSIFGSRD